MTVLYLGTDDPAWLRQVDFPLMVSHTRLRRPKAGRLRRARVPWVLDSGGFTEIARHGRWTITPSEYVDAIGRYRSEVGGLVWCAPQDWMCEPFMLATTGLTVPEHQHRTIASVLELRTAGTPVIPVLQGYALEDYHRHVTQYEDAGLDLLSEPVVGLGSVCRRQATTEIAALVRSLAPLRLHGFGVKTSGLVRYGQHLTSCDSMAWSYAGRRQRPCPVRGLTSCNHCLHFATDWRSRVLAQQPKEES